MAEGKKRKRGILAILGLIGGGGLLALLFGSRNANADEPESPDEPGSDKPTLPKTPGKPGEPTRVSPEPPPFKPTIWQQVVPKDPDPIRSDPDAPILGPAWPQLIVEYPKGASFYQVVWGDKFGGTSGTSIAYRALLSEAYTAALEHGATAAEASAFAQKVAKNNKLRAEYIDAIQCSGWNDAAYGTYGYAGPPLDPTGPSKASDHGRAIRLVQQHAPNRQLLSEGKQPFRNIRLLTPADRGNGKAYGADTSWRDWELLWLPGVNREALWQSGGTELDLTTPMWPDGTTQLNPPPWVMALGMNDTTGDLAGSFGCPGSDGELEVGD